MLTFQIKLMYFIIFWRFTIVRSHLKIRIKIDAAEPHFPPQNLATKLPTIWNSMTDCSDILYSCNVSKMGRPRQTTPYFKLGMSRHCPKVVSQSTNLVVSLDQHAKLVSFVLLQFSQFQQLHKSKIPEALHQSVTKEEGREMRHFQVPQLSSVFTDLHFWKSLEGI